MNPIAKLLPLDAVYAAYDAYVRNTQNCGGSSTFERWAWRAPLVPNPRKYHGGNPREFDDDMKSLAEAVEDFRSSPENSN